MRCTLLQVDRRGSKSFHYTCDACGANFELTDYTTLFSFVGCGPVMGLIGAVMIAIGVSALSNFFEYWDLVYLPFGGGLGLVGLLFVAAGGFSVYKGLRLAVERLRHPKVR